MTKDIVFSSEGGSYLNNEVQGKIAKHLFLLCNYNIESLKAFSEDARFFQAALNMYKFIVDAGICGNLKTLGRGNKVQWNDRRFNEISDIIVAIRTTLCHNVDELNGTDEDKIKAIEWLQRVIGKKEITCASDYEVATNELISYGAECVSILEDFICKAALVVDVQKLIREWEEIILNFYRRGNSKNIFEAQLIMAYYAKSGGGRKPLKSIVADWVKKMINMNEISTIDSMSQALEIRGLPNKTLISIKEKIKDAEEEIRKREQKIILELRTTKTELNSYDYMDYYIRTIPKKISDKLYAGNVDSLLPQDIVQQIIFSDFKDIPTV